MAYKLLPCEKNLQAIDNISKFSSQSSYILKIYIIFFLPCRVGSVGSVSASRTVGREFASRPVIPKTIIKMVQTVCCMARSALGLEFGSAAQLSKRPGSVWNCLWRHAHKRSPGIKRKSRVSCPGPGYLSSAIWPSLPKKHYNGLNQTKPNLFSPVNFYSSVSKALAPVSQNILTS